MSIDLYFVIRLITVLLFLFSLGLAVRAKWLATMETWMYWLISATFLLIAVQWATGALFLIALIFYAISVFAFGFTLMGATTRQRQAGIAQRQARMTRRSHDADL